MTQPLIERAIAGSIPARDQLLRQLADVWFRFCFSILGDAESAREAVQETALRFLAQLPSFGGHSQLKTWSLGIALNVTREMRRKRPGDATGDLTETAGKMDQPGALMQERETHALLIESLNGLSDRQRQAIVLRFFEDLSVEETAAAMNCAVGTVKATVHQALKLLKSKLGSVF